MTQTSDTTATSLTATVLEVRGVSKAFGVVQALDRVSLAVRRGSIHGIVGQNGAGKSTLMQILAGAQRQDGGSVLLAGDEVVIHDPDHACRLGIRIIYQELNLMPARSIAHNVSLGVELTRGRLGLVDRRAERRRAEALMERLGHPLPVGRRVEELSLGEQQLVEIAKALASEARLLILDEPTAALERHDIDRLFGVVRRLRDSGGTAIYVSHRLDEIFELCDTVTVLRDGRVVATTATRDTARDGVIEMMIGRPLEDIFPPRASAPAGDRALLSMRGVAATVLRDVDLDARAGRVLGVAGLEGSGIRELGRVRIGDVPVRAGAVEVGGRRVALRSPRHALRAGIVYMSADRKVDGLFAILSLSENIAVGTLSDRRLGPFVDRNAERRLVEASVSSLGIQPPSPRTEARALSGGNQQKVLVARALAAKPAVFVLDEPTRGVDVAGKAEIYRMIRGLADRGAAVVLISTDLTEVLGMADDIVVLRGGTVNAELPGGASERDLLARML
jgi:ABC-type sugar transport system ATPase subunit